MAKRATLTGRFSTNQTAPCTVTLYGVTSAVGGLSDPGADPNKLVIITDNLAATSQPAGESFATLRSATAGDVYRGVALTPGQLATRPRAAAASLTDRPHTSKPIVTRGRPPMLATAQPCR